MKKIRIIGITVILSIYILSIVTFFHLSSFLATYEYDFFYQEKYDDYLKNQAYAQVYFNATEQQEYYQKIGFFGSTQEEFFIFAEHKAQLYALEKQTAAFLCYIMIFFAFSTLELYFLVITWIDSVESKIQQKQYRKWWNNYRKNDD